MDLKGKYSIIEDNCEIAEDVIIWNFVHIREGAKIDEGTKLGDYVYVDREVKIGKNCNIQNRCDIYKGVIIEDDVFIGPNVTFTNVRKPRASHKVPVSAYVPTIVRKGATIGANCTIICGAEIGEGALIGAGATVLGNQKIPANTTAVGNPIRKYTDNSRQFHSKKDN